MVKLKSLPGYVLAVLNEDFVPAMATVATMYNTELKPVDQVNTDGTRVRLYLMRQSVALTGIAMGALDYDLPLFILKDTFEPQGRTGYLCSGAQIDPEYGNVALLPVAEVRFSSHGINKAAPYYEDVDGVQYQAQVVERSQAA